MTAVRLPATIWLGAVEIARPDGFPNGHIDGIANANRQRRRRAANPEGMLQRFKRDATPGDLVIGSVTSTNT